MAEPTAPQNLNELDALIKSGGGVGGAPAANPASGPQAPRNLDQLDALIKSGSSQAGFDDRGKTASDLSIPIQTAKIRGGFQTPGPEFGPFNYDPNEPTKGAGPFHNFVEQFNRGLSEDVLGIPGNIAAWMIAPHAWEKMSDAERQKIREEHPTEAHFMDYLSRSAQTTRETVGSEGMRKAFDWAGFTRGTEPTTPTEEIFGAGGRMAGNVAGLEAGAETVLARTMKAGDVLLSDLNKIISTGAPRAPLNIMKDAVVGAGAGAAGEAARQRVPEEFKPAAEIGGQLGGAVGLSGLENMAGKGYQFFKNLFAGPQMRAAKEFLARGGPGVRGEVARAADVPDQVPGYDRTTFQATLNPGVGGLDEEARTATAKGQAAFAGRSETQNRALVDMLGTVSHKDVSPQTLKTVFEARLGMISKVYDERIAELEANYTEARDNFGGQLDEAAYGREHQAALSDVYNKEREEIDRLRGEVLPDKTPVPLKNLQQDFAKIRAGKTQASALPAGEEQRLHDLVTTEWQGVGTIPAKEIWDLRDSLSAAIRKGKGQDVGRLTEMRNAVDDAIGRTVEARAGTEPEAVRSGLMADLSTENALHPAPANANNVEGAVSLPPPTVGGTAEQGEGERTVTAGPAANRNQNPLETPPAEALADRTNTFESTFQGTPAGESIAPGVHPGTFKVFASNVLEGIVDSPERFASYVKAAQGDPRVLANIQDYMAFSAMRGAEKGGVLSASSLSKWAEEHQHVFDAFPQLYSKFRDVNTVRTMIDQTVAGKALELEQAQTAAVKNIVKGNPDAAIGGALRNESEMDHLVDSVRGNQMAQNGLKRMVMDYLMKTGRVVTTDVVGTDIKTPSLNGKALQTMVNNNRGALEKVFSPEEMASIDKVVDEVRRASAYVSKPPGEGTSMLRRIASPWFARWGGAAIGEMITKKIGGALMGGLAGMAIEAGGEVAVAGRARRTQEAMVDLLLSPRVANEWLQKIPAGSSAEALSASIARRARNALAADVLNQER